MLRGEVRLDHVHNEVQKLVLRTPNKALRKFKRRDAMPAGTSYSGPQTLPQKELRRRVPPNAALGVARTTRTKPLMSHLSCCQIVFHSICSWNPARFHWSPRYPPSAVTRHPRTSPPPNTTQSLGLPPDAPRPERFTKNQTAHSGPAPQAPRQGSTESERPTNMEGGQSRPHITYPAKQPRNTSVLMASCGQGATPPGTQLSREHTAEVLGVRTTIPARLVWILSLNSLAAALARSCHSKSPSLSSCSFGLGALPTERTRTPQSEIG